MVWPYEEVFAMFNVLVSADETAWETDQRMAMMVERFGEYSGDEGELISAKNPETLKVLERIQTVLLYETGTGGPGGDIVRVGQMRSIRVSHGDITFRFSESGRFGRDKLERLRTRLQIDKWELTRTHWAVKDGDVPQDVLAELVQTPRRYDVVLSFAGEDRSYVETVAEFLEAHGVVAFYDKYEEVTFWGEGSCRAFRWGIPTAGSFLRHVHISPLR